MRVRYRLLPAAAAAMVILPAARLGPQGTQVDLGRVVQEIEQLDALRSSLARSFGDQGVPATRETFQQVCRPVGMRAQGLGRENGWTVQQLAQKNRNPNNSLDPEAASAYHLMQQDRDLMGTWVRTSHESKTGSRYFRRIVVEPACLACHGPRDQRPEFVKQGYPEDKAFDFNEGDLRGLYSVFVPDGN